MNNNIEAGYVFLNDGETFTSEDGCFVYILNEKGSEQLDENGELSDVDFDNIIKKISITELIDCWRDRMNGF